MTGRLNLGLLAALILAAAAPWSRGQSNKVRQAVKVGAAWSSTAIAPGGKITLAVVFDITPPFHIQPHKPEDPSFIATVVEIADLPGDLRATTPVYPVPVRVPFGEEKKTIPAYEGKTIVYATFVADAAAKPGDRAIGLKITYQSCDEKLCYIPVDLEEKVTLSVVAPGTAITPANADLFKDLAAQSSRIDFGFFGLDFSIDSSQRILLLLIAAVGGLLMNFTPCVLPLIPIKILSLSHAAGNRARCLLLGVVMSVGVIAFWMGMAAAIAGISGFTSTNQLFQYPAFSIAVGCVIAAMGVGMCGLFAIQLPQWVYLINPKQESLPGAFGFGVMTAVLSTPCTGPLMGSAASWAVTQPPSTTLITFAAIGVGMALPYLVLSAFPQLVNRMPRGGPAGELIKQVMGLLMLAAGLYFIGGSVSGLLATAPDPPSRMYWWLVAISVGAAGVWLAVKTIQLTPSPVKRVIFAGLGVFLIAAAAHIGFRFTDRGPIKWIYYTEPRLAEAQGAKKIVVLEFTAEWCLNCKALEETVLRSERIAKLFNAPDVAPIKIDLTGNNEAGNKKLNEVGRRTIPLLIIHDAAGKEVFRSDAYTAGQVVEAMAKARGG